VIRDELMVNWVEYLGFTVNFDLAYLYVSKNWPHLTLFHLKIYAGSSNEHVM